MRRLSAIFIGAIAATALAFGASPVTSPDSGSLPWYHASGNDDDNGKN